MGTGRVYFDSASNRYLIDLSVTAIYDASGDDELLWEASFRQASTYLFNATRGQMQLGKVGFLNGGTFAINVDDARLDLASTNSQSFDFFPRAPDSTILKGGMLLTSIAKFQPLEMTHEFGHYVGGLEDEYDIAHSPVKRTCTNFATSGASIMEFAKGYSVVLSVVGVAVQTTPPIYPEVTNFCFPTVHNSDNYRHQYCGGLSCVGNNYQGSESCWETLAKNFTKINIPSFSAAPSHAENAVQWFIRAKQKKYSFAVFGSESLKTIGNSFEQIKNSAIGWAKFIGGTDSLFALVADTQPKSFLRDMSPISIGNELDKLVASIKQNFENGNSQQEPPFAGLDQFDDNSIGSYQTLILVLPGNGEFSTDPIEQFVEQLANTVESKFVSLIAVTIGLGPLATELTRVEKISPRLKHVAVLPTPGDEFVGNRVQLILVESYFLESVAHGVVASSTGRLPDSPVGRGHKAEKLNPTDVRLFHPQCEGFDFPVYIEEDAEAAYFVASHSSPEEIRFTLIGPNGKKVTESSRIVFDASLKDNVQFYHVKGDQISGRWIMRLRRIETNDELPRKALPYHLFATSVNSAITFSTEVLVTGNLVEFEAATLFGKPLDFVNVRADVFTRKEFGFNPVPIKSIVLRRESLNNPYAEQLVEVSTGIQKGSTKLVPGDYVAVFHISNAGQAVIANNTDARFPGVYEPSETAAIPSFARIDRKYFSVVE